MSELIIGTSAKSGANLDLMRDAGIEWVRVGFPLPFEDRIGGKLSQRYIEARRRAQEWVDQGVRLMAVSPLPVSAGYKKNAEGELALRWTARFPAWMGAIGGDEYNRNYGKVCAFLAKDLKGIIEMWQVANELDIPIFAGPITHRQACDFILCGAVGLKETDPSLIVGFNTAGNGDGTDFYLYGRLLADSRASSLDYAGCDGYYGAWAEGNADNWGPRIALLHSMTERPILVNEWGNPSKGEIMTPPEFAAYRNGTPCCHFRKWPYGWKEGGQSEESQAEFVAKAFDSFVAQRDKLLGMYFYRWEDQEKCWQCGSEECPLEIAWGLVHVDNSPKPSYGTFKEGVRRLVG
jgi:hypothetical protein